MRLSRPSSTLKRVGQQKAQQFATAEDGSKVAMTPGQILLPGAGKANDRLRMRNGGVRRGSLADQQQSELPNVSLRAKTPDSPKGLPPPLMGLTRVETDPAPLRGLSHAESSACWGCGPAMLDLERPLAGKPRKTSQVEMTYPGGPWDRPISTPSTPSRPTSPTGRVGSPMNLLLNGALLNDRAAVATPKRSPVRKRTALMCSDDIASPPSTPQPSAPVPPSEEDPKSTALKRSMKKLECLYSMRRAFHVSSSDTSVEQQEDVDMERFLSDLAQNEADQGGQDVVMMQVLRDTADTEARLGQIEAVLVKLAGEVPDFGRHATMAVSQRTLAVVRRKRGLLKALEERLQAFEEAQASGDEIIRRLKQDRFYEPPEALVGLEKAWKRTRHKGCLSPADENKSDFALFSQTFGLPRGHKIYERLVEAADCALEWWGEAALREAKDGVEPAVLKRILSVLAHIRENDEGNEEVRRTKQALGEVLAESTLRIAQAVEEKDRLLVQNSNKAEPESARTAASFINSEITMAVSMGALPSNKMMIQAKEIATYLEAEEKDRLAHQVCEFARSQKEKDEINALHTQDSMKVGPASWAADSIEREIKKVREFGVTEMHPKIMEARVLAKKLRDEDLGRRRVQSPGDNFRSPLLDGSVEKRHYRNMRSIDIARID